MQEEETLLVHVLVLVYSGMHMMQSTFICSSEYKDQSLVHFGVEYAFLASTKHRPDSNFNTYHSSESGSCVTKAYK